MSFTYRELATQHTAEIAPRRVHPEYLYGIGGVDAYRCKMGIIEATFKSSRHCLLHKAGMVLGQCWCLCSVIDVVGPYLVREWRSVPPRDIFPFDNETAELQTVAASS